MTKTVTICRTTSRADGVFGTLAVDNFPIAVTLERPWLGNAPKISCIPAGSYRAKRINSPTHGDVFEVTVVPGRTHILIHAGNVDDDSEGCILLGESFSYWRDASCCVADSKEAMKEFMQSMKGCNEFQLTIVNCFN